MAKIHHLDRVKAFPQDRGNDRSVFENHFLSITSDFNNFFNCEFHAINKNGSQRQFVKKFWLSYKYTHNVNSCKHV